MRSVITTNTVPVNTVDSRRLWFNLDFMIDILLFEHMKNL
jgi:hypothetical protein